MKKTITPSFKISKSPLRVKHRRTLRAAFLESLSADEDKHTLDLLVDEYFDKAQETGRESRENPGNRKLVHAFLENALCLFLVASEPKSRALALRDRLYSQRHINTHQGTTLLPLILKALGPYRHRDRRTVHRDSTVLAAIIHQVA